MAEKTEDEKMVKLFLSQKELLDTFLSHGAITKAQYDKSLGDLTEKNGNGKLCEQIKKSSQPTALFVIV